MTSNSFNRRLAAQERSQDTAHHPDGGQSCNRRQHREAMARNKPPDALNSLPDDPPSQWDDTAWDQDHDEAAGHRARQLLSTSNSGLSPVVGNTTAPAAGRTR